MSFRQRWVHYTRHGRIEKRCRHNVACPSRQLHGNSQSPFSAPPACSFLLPYPSTPPYPGYHRWFLVRTQKVCSAFASFCGIYFVHLFPSCPEHKWSSVKVKASTAHPRVDTSTNGPTFFLNPATYSRNATYRTRKPMSSCSSYESTCPVRNHLRVLPHRR